MDAFVRSWKMATRVLAYSPKNEFLDKIMAETIKFGAAPLTSIESYFDSDELMQAVRVNNFTVVVQFDNDLAQLTSYPKKLAFTLRFPSILRMQEHLETWQTNVLYTEQTISGPRNPSAKTTDGEPIGYFAEGFLQIQHALTMSYIKLAANQNELPKVLLQRLPYPEYVHDMVIILTAAFLPLFFLLCFLSASSNVTKYVALEKERQLKEIMKMMGVPNWIHWAAWLIRSLIVWGIVDFIITLMFKIPVKEGFAVLIHTDALILYIFFLLYIVALICFSFMMAVFFKRSTTASSFTIITFILLFAPMFLLEKQYAELSLLSKLLICLDFNLALPFGVNIMIKREALNEGVQWHNLFEGLNDDDTLSFGLILIMFLVSACLYMLICLYVEQVKPGEYGVPRKWYFPCQCNFWSKKQRQSGGNEQSAAIKRINPLAFEVEPKNMRTGVEIQTLGKRFDDKWAVKNLSLKMYENEITVLLGHNGAGKTTTIAMLTGMLRPTLGTAIIDGYDIRKNIDDARASMGICPQQNVLFDNLSVANHLKFFSKLKGLKGAEVNAEVEKYLEKIELKPKAKALSSTLSGGMKRKLSLCCALCGDTKVVFCDEPSSGMDPAARRQLWDLLQSAKIGRTVLLTTHFMDEADVLGDRIAIMCNGDLKCHGTSFFLKKKFGSGYRLTCVKGQKCNVEGLTALLSKYIPAMKKESEIGTDLTFRLPDEYSRLFGKMLQDLEKNMQNLDVLEFGLGVSSLEEVFLKIGAENADTDVLNGTEQEARSARNPGGQKTDNEEEEKKVYKEKEEKEEKEANEAIEVKEEDKKKSRASEAGSFYFDAETEPTSSKIVMRETESGDERTTNTQKTTAETKRSSLKSSERVQRLSDDAEASLSKEKRSLSNENDESQSDETVSLTRKSISSKKRVSYKSEGQEGRRSLRRDEKDITEIESQESKQSGRWLLICSHWYAMLYKKALYTKRNCIVVVLTSLTAVLFAVIAMLAATSTQLVNLPPMTYSLKQYDKAVTMIEIIDSNNNNSKISHNYEELAKSYGANYKVESIKDTRRKRLVRFDASKRGTKLEEHLLQLGKENFVRATKEYLVGATFMQTQIIAWYNNQPWHMTPLALNLAHTAIAKTFIGPNAEITVTNHPLPYTAENRRRASQENTAGFAVIMLLGIGLAFATAYFAIFIIKENQSRAKLLQLVAGVPSYTFWLTHFIWDFLILFITSLAIILVISLFELPQYSSFEVLAHYFVLLLVFSFAVLPLTYALSLLFKDPVSGYTCIVMIYFFAGFLFIFYVILELFASFLSKQLVKVAYWIFALQPHFAFFFAWSMLDAVVKNKMLCEDKEIKNIPDEAKCKYFPTCCEPIAYYKCKTDKDNCILYIAMLISGILWLLFLILRDMGCCLALRSSCKRKEDSAEELDDDVEAERERVENMTQDEIAEYHLVLDNLKKFYGKFCAVKGLSLSVKGKECFGLLGINGAGKTTTFKMLTGDTRISSGDAYVTGISIRKQLAKVYKKIGYCPQFDGLLDEFTGRETLFIFCLLRGIPSDRIQTICEDLADDFGFMRHIDKRIKTYSGGNKRKLSTALAVVGTPAVIYLDEPTSGMDPAAQRKLWNMVCNVRDIGKLIVLTTHSMGEVEALCTKIAIMVNGQFKCIGSTQHLKSKFSKGLVLKIQAERFMAEDAKIEKKSAQKTRASMIQKPSVQLTEIVENIKAAVQAQYPTAIVESEFQGMLTMYIPLADIQWSDIFTWMEKNRQKLKIEDYSISQTSLEEVFLEFATKQK